MSVAVAITFEDFEERVFAEIREEPEFPPQRIRKRTISIKRMSKRELEREAALYPKRDHHRPKHRSECVDGERPCPFVSCKYHLYLDVSPRTGAITLNVPDLEPWEIPESCALDVADRGEITLEEVGVFMNLTRERIRQLERKGIAKLRASERVVVLEEFLGPTLPAALPVTQDQPSTVR